MVRNEKKKYITVLVNEAPKPEPIKIEVEIKEVPYEQVMKDISNTSNYRSYGK